MLQINLSYISFFVVNIFICVGPLTKTIKRLIQEEGRHTIIAACLIENSV